MGVDFVPDFVFEVQQKTLVFGEWVVCVGADVVFLVNNLEKFGHLFVDMFSQSRYQGVHKADAYNTVPGFQWEMFPFLSRLAESNKLFYWIEQTDGSVQLA